MRLISQARGVRARRLAPNPRCPRQQTTRKLTGRSAANTTSRHGNIEEERPRRARHRRDQHQGMVARVASDEFARERSEQRWQHDARMVGGGPVPRDPAADLAQLSRSDKGNPASGDRAAQRHRCEDRCKCNRHHGSSRHANGKSAGEEGDQRPEQNPKKDVHIAWVLRIDRDLRAHPQDQVGLCGKHKAREQQRNRAYTHEPRDIEL